MRFRFTETVCDVNGRNNAMQLGEYLPKIWYLTRNMIGWIVSKKVAAKTVLLLRKGVPKSREA